MSVLNNVSRLEFNESSLTHVDVNSLSTSIEHVPSSSLMNTVIGDVNKTIESTNQELTNIDNRLTILESGTGPVSGSIQPTLTRFLYEWSMSDSLEVPNECSLKIVNKHSWDTDCNPYVANIIREDEYVRISISNKYSFNEVHVPVIVSYKGRKYPVREITSSDYSRFSLIHAPSVYVFNGEYNSEYITNNKSIIHELVATNSESVLRKWNVNETVINTLLNASIKSCNEHKGNTVVIDLNEPDISSIKLIGLINTGSNICGTIIDKPVMYSIDKPLLVDGIPKITNPSISNNFNRISLSYGSVLYKGSVLPTDHVYLSNHYNEQQNINANVPVHNSIINGGILIRSDGTPNKSSIIKSGSVLNIGSIISGESVSNPDEYTFSEYFNNNLAEHFIEPDEYGYVDVEASDMFLNEHFIKVNDTSYMVSKPVTIITDYTYINQSSWNTSGDSIITPGSKIVKGSVIMNAQVYTNEYMDCRSYELPSNGIISGPSDTTIDVNVIGDEHTVAELEESTQLLINFKYVSIPVTVTPSVVVNGITYMVDVKEPHAYVSWSRNSTVRIEFPNHEFKVSTVYLVEPYNRLVKPINISNNPPNNQYTVHQLKFVDTNIVDGVVYDASYVDPLKYDIPHNEPVLNTTTCVYGSSILASNSIIATNSVVNGVRYDSSKTILKNIVIKEPSYLSLGSVIGPQSSLSEGSMINDIKFTYGTPDVNTNVCTNIVRRTVKDNELYINKDAINICEYMSSDSTYKINVEERDYHLVNESPLTKVEYQYLDFAFVFDTSTVLSRPDDINKSVDIVFNNQYKETSLNTYNKLVIESPKFYSNSFSLVSDTNNKHKTYLVLTGQDEVDVESIHVFNGSLIEFNTNKLLTSCNWIPYEFNKIKLPLNQSFINRTSNISSSLRISVNDFNNVLDNRFMYGNLFKATITYSYPFEHAYGYGYKVITNTSIKQFNENAVIVDLI